MRTEILDLLITQFSIDEEQASAMNQIEDKKQYTEMIYSVVK